MLAFLHLYLLSAGNELIIKGDIGNSLRNALTHDLKGVASASYHISGEVYSSFDHSDCAFNWALDKAFRWLIDDFPNSLGYVPDKNIRISENVYRARYFIDFLEDFFAVKLRELIRELAHSDIFVVEPGKFDL